MVFLCSNVRVECNIDNGNYDMGQLAVIMIYYVQQSENRLGDTYCLMR